MKKNVLSILIMLSCVFGYTQEDYYFDGSILSSYHIVTTPSIQSPDVSAFEKVTQVPVSNYTGRANISIPIYNIKVGGMDVPVSLTYNSSGVKVGDMPSNVGSNWALNAGGVVTKTVQGIDDFTIPKKIISRQAGADEKTSAGWLINLISSELTPSTNQQNDPAPDIYHANAPGLSTKYIHEKLNSSMNLIPIEIERKGSIIEGTVGKLFALVPPADSTNYANKKAYGMTSVKVTALNGIQYSFNKPDFSYNMTIDGGYVKHLTNDGYKINALKLNSMYNPASNQTIDFEYELYSNTFYDTFTPRPNSVNYSYMSKTNRLSRISFDGGIVEFVYGLDRLDNTGEKALTEVKVKNHLGDIIKHVKLDYSYFQSIINTSSPQSKRLRLDRVYEVDKNGLSKVGAYEFTYNSNINMPPRDSWAHDFLGYNNGSYVASNTTPVPKIYRDDSAYQTNYYYPDVTNKVHKRIYIPFNNGTTPLKESSGPRGNFSLEANEEASKAYILTSIKYPTGGRTEFEYESNRFIYQGEKLGGGLRIKSQKIIDEYGVEQIQDYSYGNGYIGGLPNYVGVNPIFKIYNVAQSQVEFTSGSFVGYDRVAVSSRYDKRVKYYYYHNHNDFPNISSTKTIFGNDGIESKAWRAKAFYTLSIDRDILRGKLKSMLEFNRNGVQVLKQDYDYVLKEFRTINYSFQNPIYDPTKSNRCFSDTGLYLRYCGGYDEVISFPIERNLLVNVKTTIYEDHHDASLDSPQDATRSKYTSIEKRYQYDSEYPRLLSEKQGRNLGNYYDEEEFEDSINRCMGNAQCEEEVRSEFIGQQEGSSSYIEKRYTYPRNTSPLWGQHRLMDPESISIRNEKGMLKTEDYYYKDFGEGILALEKVDNIMSQRFSIDPKTSDIVTKRDHKGNILEILSQSGIYTSFIYGYGSRYLVCELKNVSYNELNSSLRELNISLNSIVNSNDNNVIKRETQQLRELLEQGQITSYTHKPLVGVTGIVDIRGRETTYEYDDYNRLIYVKDHDQNIISKNSYKYKN